MKYIFILLICSFIVWCQKESIQIDAVDSKTPDNSPIIVTELSTLPYLISLPKQPISVKWQKPGPDPERTFIVALFKFSPQDYNEIVAKSPNFDLIQDARIPKEFFNKWVDESISSQLDIEESDDGIYILKGVNDLKPDLFTQAPSSPFIHGDFTPLGNGFILLTLHTL